MKPTKSEMMEFLEWLKRSGKYFIENYISTDDYLYKPELIDTIKSIIEQWEE
jgi:hypothetical protein